MDFLVRRANQEATESKDDKETKVQEEKMGHVDVPDRQELQDHQDYLVAMENQDSQEHREKWELKVHVVRLGQEDKRERRVFQAYLVTSTVTQDQLDPRVTVVLLESKDRLDCLEKI